MYLGGSKKIDCATPKASEPIPMASLGTQTEELSPLYMEIVPAEEQQVA
ncbi:unnamed protein product [Penicillium salamii]|nr:unnamed protein product [Penicillium salamii]